jgi:hypothetical protein
LPALDADQLIEDYRRLIKLTDPERRDRLDHNHPSRPWLLR